MTDNGEREQEREAEGAESMTGEDMASAPFWAGRLWWIVTALLLVLLAVLAVMVVRKRSKARPPQPQVTVSSSAEEACDSTPAPQAAPVASPEPSASVKKDVTKTAERRGETVAADLAKPQGISGIEEIESKGETLASFVDEVLWGAAGGKTAVSKKVTRSDVEEALETAIDLYKTGKRPPKDKLLVSVLWEALGKAAAKASEESPEEVSRLEIQNLRVMTDGRSVPYSRQARQNLLIARDELGLTISLPYGLSLRLVLVTKGAFTLGSKDDDDGRGLHEAERKISLSDDYWLGEHEVTRCEWKAIMGCVTADRSEGDDCPMVYVNRFEALAFCAMMNDLYGDKLPKGYVFCLPTCAQWEYASRGGAGGRGFRYSGGDDLEKLGWFAANSEGRLHPVAQKQPNELGLFDMSGNAMEYCLDNWPDPKADKDPLGEICTWPYGVRGGSFSSGPWECRVSSFALMQGRHGRYGTVGFRLAIVPKLIVEVEEEGDEEEELEDAEDKDAEEKDDEALEDDKKLERKSETDKKKDSKEEKEGERKRKRRSNAPLLRTRSDSLKHEKAETIDWKNRRLLQTREQLEHQRQQGNDEEPEAKDGKDGKDGKKRRRRSSAPLLQTREEVRREQEREGCKDEGKEEDEEDKKGGKKRRRRSSAPLLRTREDVRQEREQEERGEETPKEVIGPDGKKRRGRYARPMLRTRGESLDHSSTETIDWKHRKLLQTREEQQEAKRKDKEGKEEKADRKKKERRERKERKRQMLDLSQEQVTLDLGDAVEVLMLRIPCGRLTLGSAPDEPERGQDEEARTFALEDRLWLGQVEVTQELFWVVMGYNPSVIRGDGQRPVDNVTWNEAMIFCQRLTRRFKDRLPSGYVFRLPTEDEWEFAARGGARENSGIYSGGNDLTKLGWFVGNAEGLSQLVGLKKGNPLRLQDMSGNVSEWCLNGCNRNEYGEVKEAASRPKKEQPYRIRRGGAWCLPPRASRVAARFSSAPDFRANFVGFRVALGRRIR